jgi:hypothetical protein
MQNCIMFLSQVTSQKLYFSHRFQEDIILYFIHSLNLNADIYRILPQLPTLLYGSETWVPTKRYITRLEAAEMR